MSKPAFITVLACFFIILALTVNAQVNDSSSIAKLSTGGIAPDSSFYFFDKLFDKISLAIAFDEAVRAERALRIADERLAEAAAMAAKGNLEGLQRAGEEHGMAVANAVGALKRINTGIKPEQDIEATEKIARLQNRIEAHYRKSVKVMADVAEHQGSRLGPEQLIKLGEVFGNITEDAHEVVTAALTKRANAEVKYKALTGKGSEEVKAKENEIDEKTGLSEGRKERTERAAAERMKAEKAVPKAPETKAEAKPEEKKGEKTEEKEQSGADGVVSEVSGKINKAGKEKVGDEKAEAATGTAKVGKGKAEQGEGKGKGGIGGVAPSQPVQPDTGQTGVVTGNNADVGGATGIGGGQDSGSGKGDGDGRKR